MRTRLATVLGATVIATGTVLSAPAAQAQPQAISVPFHVANGNTWTDGTITFFDRSVTITGTHKSVSTASYLTYRNTSGYTLASGGGQMGYSRNDLSEEARGNTRAFTFNVPADAPGGAAIVRVCLTDGLFTPLTCDLYTRSG
ncbi:hypothetical protein ACIBLA_00260 [Streptomyces sp. NPDC050433]|uniref:hypothetical protein n=1 Tax=Streptomyces TaxID=1883 RepID=UPI00343DB9A2